MTGYRPAPADDRPTLRIGMLGAGGIAKAHVNGFRTIPYIFWPGSARTELAAIAGRTEARVRDAAVRYGFRRYTTDWRTVVDDPEIDVFDNVGPDALHLEPTLAAIAAGKHVACEKPLALSAADCERLWRAAEKRGVAHLACFNYRFLPAVRLARTLIENGELGDIFEARFRYSQHRGMDEAAPPWTVGTLNAIGCHVIDQARFLVGEISTVSAVVRGPMSERRAARGIDPGTPLDSVHMVLEFANGSAGVLDASSVASGRRNQLAWEINGSRGSVAWELENLNVLRVHRRNGADARVDGFTEVIVCEDVHQLADVWWDTGHLLGWEHGHVNMLAHFCDAIAKGTAIPPYGATFLDGLRAAQASEAALASAQSGTRVTVEAIPADPIDPSSRRDAPLTCRRRP
jgi:predicted dehydrogenase